MVAENYVYDKIDKWNCDISKGDRAYIIKGSLNSCEFAIRSKRPQSGKKKKRSNKRPENNQGIQGRYAFLFLPFLILLQADRKSERGKDDGKTYDRIQYKPKTHLLILDFYPSVSKFRLNEFITFIYLPLSIYTFSENESWNSVQNCIFHNYLYQKDYKSRPH